MNDEPDRFVLDACALIAYFHDEVGAERLEQLLDQAHLDEIELYVASVNAYEVFYDALRRTGSERANELLADVYSLPLSVVETIDQVLIQLAGRFKVTYRMSLADSLALALAGRLNARLVTTDHHEFDVVEAAGAASFYWLR